MTAVVTNRIGSVFVPVSDMRKAIDWYSRLFGLEPGEPSHDGGIYDVPMEGETGLILDANKPVSSHSVQPHCFFWTDDIATAIAHLHSIGAEIITDIDSVAFVAFQDLDGNPLMICQRQ